MPQTNKPRHYGHRKRPVTNWRQPRAYALCDRCKHLTYRDELREQMEYRGGTSPVPTGLLVCPECYDTPNAQFAPPLLKPDPVPVYMPRPDDTGGNPFLIAWDGSPFITNVGIASIVTGTVDQLATTDGNDLVTTGGDQLIMTGPHQAVPGDIVFSIIAADGSQLVTAANSPDAPSVITVQ